MTPTLIPTPTQERIKVIDVVRGFALFGVFLVNTAMFNSTMLESGDSALSNPWLAANTLEWLVGLFIQIFGEGKFYTIFTFLFGVGFYLFEKRAQEKGLNAKALFKRRLGYLFLFGLFNFSFVWYGDILHAYAIIGFCMVPFCNCKPKTILVWAVSLLTVFILIYSALSMLNESSAALDTPSSTEVDVGEQFMDQFTERMNAVYHSGSYLETIKFRVTAETWLVLISLLIIGPKILAMFLLGLYVGKKDWISKLEDHMPELKRFFIIAAVLAIGMSAGYVSLQAGAFGKLDSLGNFLFHVIKELSIVVSAAAYASGIAYLYLKGKLTQLFNRLGSVGLMALTNYLIQCFLLSWLFYGHGLGLMNHLPLGAGTGITIVIFIIQMYYSPLWLRSYVQGPCEKLWRKLTYSKLKMETS